MFVCVSMSSVGVCLCVCINSMCVSNMCVCVYMYDFLCLSEWVGVYIRVFKIKKQSKWSS